MYKLEREVPPASWHGIERPSTVGGVHLTEERVERLTCGGPSEWELKLMHLRDLLVGCHLDGLECLYVHPSRVESLVRDDRGF
jgi:hypothetical protein